MTMKMTSEEKIDPKKQKDIIKDIISDVEQITDCKKFFWAPKKPEDSRKTLDNFSVNVKRYVDFLDQADNQGIDSEVFNLHKAKLKACLIQIVKYVNDIFNHREICKNQENKGEHKGKIAAYMHAVKKAISNGSLDLPFNPPKKIKAYDKYVSYLDGVSSAGSTLKPVLDLIAPDSTKQTEIVKSTPAREEISDAGHQALNKPKSKPVVSEEISDVRYQAFLVVIVERIKKKYRHEKADPRFKKIKTALDEFLKRNGLPSLPKDNDEDTESEISESEISGSKKLKTFIAGIVDDINKKTGLGWLLYHDIQLPKNPHLRSTERNGIQFILEKVDEEYREYLNLIELEDDSADSKGICSKMLHNALVIADILEPEAPSQAGGSKKETSHSGYISSLRSKSQVSVSGGAKLPSTTDSKDDDDGIRSSDSPLLERAISFFSTSRTSSRTSSPAKSASAGATASPSSRSVSPAKGTDEANSQPAQKTTSDIRYEAFIAVIHHIRDQKAKWPVEVNELLKKFYVKHGLRDDKGTDIKLSGREKLKKLIAGITLDIYEGKKQGIKYEFRKGMETSFGLGWALVYLQLSETRADHLNGIEYILEKVDAEYEKRYQEFLKLNPQEEGSSASKERARNLKERVLKHFKGENNDIDLRKYESWYSVEALADLTYANDPKQNVVRYILLPQSSEKTSFINQLRQLNILKNQLKKPILFIATEPGTTETHHFIFGLLFDDKLLIINPIGKTRHKPFYEVMGIVEKDLRLNLYFSNTVIQSKDIESGLVSCGPICVELMQHLTRVPSSDVHPVLSNKDKQHEEELKNEDGGVICRYQGIDIGDQLLPESLQKLRALSASDTATEYRTDVEDIRRSHLVMLETGEFLQRDEEELINQLILGEIAIDKLDKDPRYQRLQSRDEQRGEQNKQLKGAIGSILAFEEKQQDDFAHDPNSDRSCRQILIDALARIGVRGFASPQGKMPHSNSSHFFGSNSRSPSPVPSAVNRSPSPGRSAGSPSSSPAGSRSSSPAKSVSPSSSGVNTATSAGSSEQLPASLPPPRPGSPG